MSTNLSNSDGPGQQAGTSSSGGGSDSQSQHSGDSESDSQQSAGGHAEEVEDSPASSASDMRFRLKENPVHEHFKFTSDDKKSTCKLCKVQLAGKNPTSLSKCLFPFLISFFLLFVEVQCCS
jgi:hypothetical protein